MAQSPYVRLNLSGADLETTRKAEALVEEIAGQIKSGLLPSGMRLPPVRVLAHQLDISKNTVQNAYDELAARGLVETRDRSGVFIKADPQFETVEKRGSVPAPPQLQVISRKHSEPMPSEGVIQLSNVFIESKLLPMERMEACFRSVLQTPGLPAFYDRQGYMPLREKIATRLQARGMDVQPQNILITTGSQQALDITCRALAKKSIACENPAYAVGKALFEMNQMKVTGLPLNPFKPFPYEVWERRLERDRPGLLYITTNFQNPTGYSYNTSELMTFLKWSAQYGFGILEDDWGSDMLSWSEFRPPLRALGGERVFYMNSFTKKLIPSMRIGFLTAPQDLMPTLVTAKQVATLAHSTLEEMALFEFIDRGYYDAHLEQMQAVLDERYHLCLAKLTEMMPAEVRWTRPGGGPILWLELPPHIDLDALVVAMGQRNVAIHHNPERFFGTPHLHGFPIGYAFNPPPVLENALTILREEMEKLA